jgi:hypothetical protein
MLTVCIRPGIDLKRVTGLEAAARTLQAATAVAGDPTVTAFDDSRALQEDR